MALLTKIEAGLVVTAIGFAFWLGSVHTKVDQLDNTREELSTANQKAIEELSTATKKAIADVQDASTESGLKTLPKGIILAWTDKDGRIPAGWAICDGTHGTPDLRDRFLRGGVAMAEIGTTGGTSEIPASLTGSHVLSLAEMPKHSHIETLSGGPGSEQGYGHTIKQDQSWGYSNIAGGKTTKAEGGDQGHTHPVPLQENRPLFFTVLYIMKLP